MLTKNDLLVYLDLFLELAINQAPSTIYCKNYANKNFIFTLPDNFNEISEKMIYNWIDTLSVTHNTKVVYLNKVRLFLLFLKVNKINVFIPEIPKNQDKYTPYIFTSREIEIVIKYFDNISSRDSYKRYTYPILIRLLVSTGMRIGEALSIRMNSVNLDEGIITLTETKRRKERFIPLNESMNSFLKIYCYKTGYHFDSENFLFRRCDKNIPLTIQEFYYVFKKAVNSHITYVKPDFNKRGICVHSLRHYFVFTSYKQATEKGINVEHSLPFLSTYLGHSSLNETTKYLKFPSDMQPNALMKFEDYTSDLFPTVMLYED